MQLLTGTPAQTPTQATPSASDTPDPTQQPTPLVSAAHMQLSPTNPSVECASDTLNAASNQMIMTPEESCGCERTNCFSVPSGKREPAFSKTS